MATTRKAIHRDEGLARYLLPILYKGRPKHLLTFASELASKGELQTSTMLENAIIKISGKVATDAHGMDFTDRSDAKTATASLLKHGTGRQRGYKMYSARIGNIETKKGKLRICVYEPFGDKTYLFVIPRNVHKGNKYIRISFNPKTYEPKPTIYRDAIDWWKYQVETFQEFATA